jgi:hypothetical protein
MRIKWYQLKKTVFFPEKYPVYSYRDAGRSSVLEFRGKLNKYTHIYGSFQHPVVNDNVLGKQRTLLSY